MLLSMSAPSWAGSGCRGAFGSVVTVNGAEATGAVTTTLSSRVSTSCASAGKASEIATASGSCLKLCFMNWISSDV